MPKTNFSTEQQNALDLSLDLMRGDFSLRGDNGEQLTKKDLENHLRDIFQNDLMHGRTMYQALRRNGNDLFEIVEEMVNIVIGEEIPNVPFIENFVEIKNRALGDNTAWYSEGTSYLSVASFAGNHWDTNRQSVDLGQEFTLPREWVFCHVYEELERFLLGITSMEKMNTLIVNSVLKYMKERIYMQFQNVSSSVPAEFTKSGNSEEALGDLCDLVQAAGGYDNITIAGTKGALRRITNVIPQSLIADSQKESRAATGIVGEWDGHKLIEIPQVKKPDAFELALDNKKLFIMGGDVKPIKLEYVGDTRSDIDTTGKKYNDMSVDYQVQTCFGLGLLIPSYFGVFNFAG